MTIVPESIADEVTLAMESVVKEALDKIDYTKFIVSIPELADDEVLSFLAEQRHVRGFEGWNSCKTREEKIALLNSAYKLHKKKGTLGAVEDALKISNIDVKLQNWYQYQGRPHYYKILFNLINQELSLEILKEIYKKVEEYKQIRAKQENFEINATVQGAFNIQPICKTEIIKLILPMEEI